jgi:hypothetical protein
MLIRVGVSPAYFGSASAQSRSGIMTGTFLSGQLAAPRADRTILSGTALRPADLLLVTLAWAAS